MPSRCWASHKVVIYSKNFSSSMFYFLVCPVHDYGYGCPFLKVIFFSFFVYALCLYSVQRRRWHRLGLFGRASCQSHWPGCLLVSLNKSWSCLSTTCAFLSPRIVIFIAFCRSRLSSLCGRVTLYNPSSAMSLPLLEWATPYTWILIRSWKYWKRCWQEFKMFLETEKDV